MALSDDSLRMIRCEIQIYLKKRSIEYFGSYKTTIAESVNNNKIIFEFFIIF